MSLVELRQSSRSEAVTGGAMDKVVVRKRTVIDFNDVTVEGELTKPEGSYLLNRNKTRFQSLIRLRDNFNPELQKSADNL